MAVTLPAVDSTVYFMRGGVQVEATVTGVWVGSEDGMINLSVPNEGEYRNVIYSEQPRNNRWGNAGDGGIALTSLSWGGCPAPEEPPIVTS